MIDLHICEGSSLGSGVVLPPYEGVAAPAALDASGSLTVGVAVGLAIGLVITTLVCRRISSAARSIGKQILAIRSPADEFSVPSGTPGVIRPLTSSLELAWLRLREAVARAEREREGIETVLSGMADGIIVTDARGTVTFVNKTQLSRLGTSEAQAVGRSFIEVAKDHEMHALVKECLAAGEEKTGTVETMPGRRYFGLTATPLPEDGGCVVVLQDLTEIRHLEKVRRDFVANISHELRTPLASLKLLAETLESGGVDDPPLVRDYVGRIGVEVDRLAQMVDELGELSLVETGQVVLERGPVGVRAVVERVAARLEAQAARAGVDLVLDVPKDLPQPVGDVRRVEQVLVNLVHNAIKFTAPGGHIILAARAEVDKVVVSVADTGTGIAEEDLERIFERFYKADKSRSTKGTGLGLAIARHIVEAHAGALWADSVEGRGSTFYFSLPL